MKSIKRLIGNFAIIIITLSIFSVYAQPILPKKNTFIFELDGVLFEENRQGYIKKIGFGSLARYKLSCWKDPGEACLDMLDHISKQEKKKAACPIVRKGRHMPRCIYELHCGKKTHNQVRVKLAKHIEHLDNKNYFKNEHQKKIHQQIIDISLDPEQLADIAKPNKPMMELVKNLKKQHYKIYIVSNLSKDQFKQFKEKYPQFVELFDDIVISANVQKVKPDIEIYKHLIDIHKLNPDQCVLIDNQADSISTAKELGFTIIHFDNNHHNVLKQLRSLNIVY